MSRVFSLSVCLPLSLSLSPSLYRFGASHQTDSLKAIDWGDLADAVQALADGCGREPKGICGTREHFKGVSVYVGGGSC